MAARKKESTFGSLLIQGAREAVAHKRGELVAETTCAKAIARVPEEVEAKNQDAETDPGEGP